MFRIAICISGQIRTYKQCLLNQKRLFENLMINKNDVTVDYFFHTWDTNQWTSNGDDKMNLHKIPHEKAEIDIDFIKSNVNLIDYKIDVFDPEMINNHWGPVLYSMHYCNYLKRKTELRLGYRYDLVIKTRFDILFNPFSSLSILTPIEDYVMYTVSPMSRMDIELNYYNFDDVFFYGSSFTMDILMDTYRYVNRNLSHHDFARNIENHNIPVEYFYGPGCLLYRYGTLCGLSSAKIGELYYIVARKSVMTENLDGIKDYDRIRQIHTDYYNNKLPKKL